MPTEIMNWGTQLGVAGAALTILFVFVWMFMNSNNKNITNLCSKIDKLADTNTEVVKTLTQTVTKVTEDNINNKGYLTSIDNTVDDIKAKVDSIDTKIDTAIKICMSKDNK